jgi:hypothetical protein
VVIGNRVIFLRKQTIMGHRRSCQLYYNGQKSQSPNRVVTVKYRFGLSEAQL